MIHLPPSDSPLRDKRTEKRIENVLAKAVIDDDSLVQAFCYIALGSRASAMDVANFTRDPKAVKARINRMSAETAAAVVLGR